MITTVTKDNAERKGFSPLLREVKTGSQGRNPREMLLSGLLSQACSVDFLIQSRPSYLGMVLPTVALGPSPSIINQENVPTDMSRGQSDGSNFSVEILSSQEHLGLCQVGNNQDRYQHPYIKLGMAESTLNPSTEGGMGTGGLLGLAGWPPNQAEEQEAR